MHPFPVLIIAIQEESVVLAVLQCAKAPKGTSASSASGQLLGIRLTV